MGRRVGGEVGRWGRLAAVVALSTVLAAGGLWRPHPADADDDQMSELQAQVEATAQAYEDATAKVADLNDQIDQNTARIAQIQDELPALKEASLQAIRSLYLYEDNGSIWMTLLFDSENFNDLLQTYDYLSRYEKNNLDAIETAAQTEQELSALQTQLTADQASAVAEQDAAEQAMQEATAAREQAAAEAAAEAAAQAAAAQAAAQAAQTTSVTTTDGTAITTDGTATTGDGGTDATIPVVDSGQVDWSADKASFVASWSARIDNYLAGSNLEGQGTNFAAAAWDYGVDPRLSPAISCVESGKGAVCFRPYNAWGWGSSGYSSWEEAIYAHISGFARIYGGTLTYEGAISYSGQSDPTEWYNLVYGQMELI